MPKHLVLPAFIAAVSVGARYQSGLRQIAGANDCQVVLSNWYTVLEKPDWWVVIVAALTGVAIAWQAFETRRATQAMQAANRATASSQRARLKIQDAHKDDPWAKRTFQLTALNVGTTIAEVVSVESTVAHRGSEIFKELDSSEFPMPTPRKFSEPHFIMPGDQWQFAEIFIWDVVGEEFEDDILSGKRIPVWYGAISYKDFFGDVHRFQFFYMYSGREKQFCQIGPKGWNIED